ncbi:conserved domain protein [Plakobranchus ocellatus]|uniref:Conserved domain protein n=1 Tax=Plakobranchus ocellatus TaxID=259542 RepID=A0AAV4CD36_9GAST|nr:conserved domain protein [Plakobranchus ocellatus]
MQTPNKDFKISTSKPHQKTLSHSNIVNMTGFHNSQWATTCSRGMLMTQPGSQRWTTEQDFSGAARKTEFFDVQRNFPRRKRKVGSSHSQAKITMIMTPAMDVVFSFDTTGSMSLVLDEVKSHLNNLIQRLQADIPQFKVGIIAHGDYCDRGEFYDIRTLDLTDKLPDVVTFVNETGGTGGGDTPECYELALRHADNMSWRNGSTRVLVVIGDAFPHTPDYCLNTLKIDWQDELSSLVAKSVRVYGVQYGQDTESVSFFQQLTSRSGGQHLRLQDMGDICHIIMAICYREQGPGIFRNYEAEVRADKIGDSLGSGLENIFGALGKSHGDKDHANKSPVVSTPSSSPQSSAVGVHLNIDKFQIQNGTGSGQAMLNLLKRKKDNEPSPSKHFCSFAKMAKLSNSAKHINTPEHDSVNVPVSVTTNNMATKKNANSTNNLKSPKKRRTNGQNSAKDGKPSKHTAKERKGQDSQSQRSRRECISDKYFQFNDLLWSKWHLAAAKNVPQDAGIWKTVAQRDCQKTLWRVDLLRHPEAKLDEEFFSQLLIPPRRKCKTQPSSFGTRGLLFELGVISPESRAIHTVWLHATNHRNKRKVIPTLLREPWYTGLTRSIREPLTKAVKAGSRVYLRWAVVEKVQTMKRKILAKYIYAWRA